jgi:hypothetical protein
LCYAPVKSLFPIPVRGERLELPSPMMSAWRSTVELPAQIPAFLLPIPCFYSRSRIRTHKHPFCKKGVLPLNDPAVSSHKPRQGLEPGTDRLQNGCTAHCASEANHDYLRPHRRIELRSRRLRCACTATMRAGQHMLLLRPKVRLELTSLRVPGACTSTRATTAQSYRISRKAPESNRTLSQERTV